MSVAWLQLVPISDHEARYTTEYGTAALGTWLEQHAVDVCDFNRAPVAPQA